MKTSIRWSFLATLFALFGGEVHAIYDDDHWSYSTKLTEENFDSFLTSQLEASKIIRAFTGNEDVAFGDVSLAESPTLRRDYSPGMGGWPTIRYFNKETGVQGGVYEKKTNMSMCEELGPKYDYLKAYIEDYAKTKQPVAADGSSQGDEL